jgi:transglutaminase-like putative cysteine protease
MRLSIRHETCHRYERPVKSVIQTLRLTPRNHEGQHVVHWRIDVDVECRLRASQDAFGNIVHGFTSNGPHSMITVTAIGEVETFDTRGVVSGGVERFPPDLYLRPTPMTHANADVRAFSERVIAGEVGELDRLHGLLRAMPQAGPLRACQSQGGASQTQEASSGETPPEDLAHLFIACARHIDIPARYIAGYRLPDTPAILQGGHGWAEAFVPRLGWVGFDPANVMCPDERYVRVAIGLDSLGAMAMRGAHAGGADRPTEVKLTVTQSRLREQG